MKRIIFFIVLMLPVYFSYSENTNNVLEIILDGKDGVDWDNTPNVKTIHVNGNPVALYDPYTRGMTNPLCGQIHVHTTNSDGSYPPKTVAAKMKEAGYDFWTITDHNFITPDPKVNDLIWLCNAYEDTRDTQHTNIYNIPALYNSNNINDIITHFVTNGNSYVMYNHPDWTPQFQPDTKIANVIKGLSFVEVFNITGTTETDRAFDILLSKGHRIWGVASDDFHNDSHLKKGWVVAYSASRDPNDIMQALLTGCFVSSSGFTVKNVELVGNTIKIDTGSPTAVTTFYKENMTALSTTTGKNAEYSITGNEMFVRAVIKEGNARCWVQPYFILSENTGLNEIDASNLKIYPNPFENILSITGAENSTLRIMNVIGVVVHIQKITGVNEPVDLQPLPAGMYFFCVEKDGQTKMVKGVKK